MIEAGGLMGEGAGKPGLSSAGLAGEDDLLAGPDPVALGERQDLTPVEAAAGGEIDVFDTGVREAHAGIAQPVGEALVGTGSGFAVEHEAEPFVAVERLVRVLFAERFPGFKHACEAERGHLVEGRMCEHVSLLCGGYW